MRLLSNFAILLRGFFFPQVCGLCDGSLSATDEMRIGLCRECYGLLIRSSITLDKGQKCNLCGKPLISEKDICLSCRNSQNSSYDKLWVLFPYTGKLRKLLSAYKFKKNLNLADFFAEKVLDIISGVSELKDAILVPVPPRPGKIKENGWDQVDYLVKRLLKQSSGSIKVQNCLKRRKSKVQKSLDRIERMENLKGRIYLHKTSPKTVLIIDDVITTGSTIEVCSAVLKENGAEKVYGLALFYD